MRLFLAVWLSPELHERATTLIERLKPGSTGIKWTPKEQLHLTLKFLGEQPPALLEKMHPLLEKVSRETSSFELAFGEGGVFPLRGEPRVLWVGLQNGVVPLSNLAKAIEDVCAECGVPKEDRPFKAHLTTGRVKGSPVRFDEEHLRKGIEGTMRVEGFAVVESKLSPRGPNYETLRVYELNK